MIKYGLSTNKKVNGIRVLFITLMLKMPLLSFAQSNLLRFKHVTIEQGLSNSTIETIFQDSRGFMWFGTRDGLNRYDGHQIVVYRNDEHDNDSISDNFIFCITEDHLHNLWVGTKNGLNQFNFLTDKFTRYNYDPRKGDGLSDNQISSVYEDKNHRLWIGTYMGGLNLFDPQKAKFTHYVHLTGDPTTISSNMVTNLFEDDKGNLWVATRNGINLFDRASKKFTLFLNQSDPQRTGINNNILNIRQTESGALWLGTEDGGLFHFDIAANTFRVYKHNDRDPSSIGSDMIKSMFVDHKKQLWVGSINGGLDLFDPVNHSFIHNQNIPSDHTSLSQKTVSAIFEDNQSNLWIGTHRGGLNLYSPGANRFKLYRQEARANSLGYYDITAFCQDHKGRIWIGSDFGGIDLFDKGNDSFIHYRHDPYNNSSISSNAVLNIMEDKNDHMWVSTWGGGLNLFDREKGNFRRFLNKPGDPYSISSNHVQQTFQDSKQNIWVATYFGGLNWLDSKNFQFHRLIDDPAGKTRLYGNNVVALNEDKNNNLWIGTDDGGLNCYNLTSKHFTHYFYNPGRKPDIRVIFIDSKGRLWIGQNGLYLFNPQKDSFSVYTSVAGLSKTFIKGIIEDSYHDFWISTSKGLIKFNPETFAYKVFNPEDGLQDLEFEANAILKTKEGELFFGGINGFNRFFPDQIKENKFIPPVYITNFQIFNKAQLPGQEGSVVKNDITSTRHVVLQHWQSTISFTFAALNYTAPLNNTYTYKLEGFDKNWITAGSEQKASYTNLDVGDYTFEVRASNNDGLWNKNGASLKITILPPFWETWWFRTIFAVIFAVLLYQFYKSRRQRALKALNEQKKEEMHQLQLEFFTNISHEFRTPLSLILGPLEQLKHENIRSDLAHFYHTIYRNAHRLMNLIDELMDFRKVEDGALKLKIAPGDLGQFLQGIAEEFKDFTRQKQIEFHVTNSHLYEEVWFDHKVVEKIVLNLLNNAFKYTADGGTITLDIFHSIDDFRSQFENGIVIKSEQRAKRYFYIRVADNGIGISKESIAHLFERYYRVSSNHLGSGVGLAFIKSLTKLHKGDICVYSEKNVGTEVIVALPLGKENYADEDKVKTENQEAAITLESKPSRFRTEYEIPGVDVEKYGEVNALPQKAVILLVDDNEELRKFFKDTLSPFYQIREAQTGMDGLEIARENNPDLIISDIMMPVMDGIEFCRAIKNDIATSHIPFIMLTAKDTIDSKIEGAESGADMYFAKPVNIELLLATIRKFFEQRQKLKEYYQKNYYAEAKELANTKKDKDFIDNLTAIIDAKITNPELDVDLICQELNMSRTKVYQKIKTITGQSIVEFIRSCRLKKAVKIMTQEDVSLNEVIFRIGIQTQSHFTKSFKKEFGKNPSQFLQELTRK